MRRGRSVPPNVTLAARRSSDRVRTSTAAVVGGVGVDGVPKETAQTPPEVRLTADVHPTKDGGLEVLVAWDWTAFADSASAGQKAGGGQRPKVFEFIIHWARKTCNADDRLPHCDDPDAYYSNSAWSRGPKVRVISQTTTPARL